MSVALARNIGHFIEGIYALDQTTVLACTTDAGDIKFGRTIDRTTLPRRYLSCKSLLAVQPDLVAASSTGGRTVSVTAGLQHSHDASSWVNYSTGTQAALVLGSSASATATGPRSVAEQSIDLSGARRYIRQTAVASFPLSTSTSESVKVAGILAMSGGEETPASG